MLFLLRLSTTQLYTLTKDSAMTPDTPSVSGGAVESWSITPSLPTGLTFNMSLVKFLELNCGFFYDISTVTAKHRWSATTTIERLVNELHRPQLPQRWSIYLETVQQSPLMQVLVAVQLSLGHLTSIADGLS